MPEGSCYLHCTYKATQLDSPAWQGREIVMGKWMLSCTGWGGNRLLGCYSLSSNFPLSLSVLFISPPYSFPEEMKDLVESSQELESILTDSIQSKGKGVGEALTLRSYLARLSIYKLILISGHSCWIKIHFTQRILSAVQLSVTRLHSPCLCPHPLSVSISFSL